MRDYSCRARLEPEHPLVQHPTLWNAWNHQQHPQHQPGKKKSLIKVKQHQVFSPYEVLFRHKTKAVLSDHEMFLRKKAALWLNKEPTTSSMCHLPTMCGIWWQKIRQCCVWVCVCLCARPWQPLTSNQGLQMCQRKATGKCPCCTSVSQWSWNPGAQWLQMKCSSSVKQ